MLRSATISRVDPFARPTKSSEIGRAYLVTSDRKLVRFRDDSAESPLWSNAYLMTRDLGYVFAAAEYAPAVYLACGRSSDSGTASALLRPPSITPR